MKRFPFVLLLLLTVIAHADEAERTKVDAIREKYWARGEEAELGVVQNRTYSKEGKLEAGIFGGVISSDPFLNIKTIGGSVGYHLSEYVALEVLGFKIFSSASSALKVFQNERGATTNTNEPSYFFGGEVIVSPIYGKLSLAGTSILYYDLHVIGGFGRTTTETGSYLTGLTGIGQQIYITKAIAIRADYRPMLYHEEIAEKVIPTKIGQIVDRRWSWNHTITLGATFLLGLN